MTITSPKIARRFAVLLLLLAPVFAAAPLRAELVSFSKSELTIETSSGKHRFTIEEAKTEAQMEQGLMYRRSMAPDAGMLFEYQRPQIVTFWMKNTLIPLDMVFIAADGTIADIHERAVPLLLDPINSAVPVLGVLELNGGTVARLGIKRGDRVHHPMFGNAS
jgi:uncharacterized membrane protein (UPF0127 family)